MIQEMAHILNDPASYGITDQQMVRIFRVYDSMRDLCTSREEQDLCMASLLQSTLWVNSTN